MQFILLLPNSWNFATTKKFATPKYFDTPKMPSIFLNTPKVFPIAKFFGHPPILQNCYKPKYIVPVPNIFLSPKMVCQVQAKNLPPPYYVGNPSKTIFAILNFFSPPLKIVWHPMMFFITFSNYFI